MCTNLRLIKTAFMKRPIYVKCGRCKACLQEKAMKRVTRIKNTDSTDFACLLVTLTYRPGCAPYVLRDEAYDFSQGNLDSLCVYRDCSVRKVRKPSDFNDYNQVYKFSSKRVVLDTIDFVYTSTLLNTKDLKKEFGKIGICYYKDYQHFIARLRLNLKRHYDYDTKFFVYACSEYGIKSLRPHFHLLIFVRKSDKEIMRSAIYESWPFSNLRRFKHSIEETKRSASYVASYVNCGSNFPRFFQTYAKVRHSYSKGFGANNPRFSLDNILSKFQQGTLSYSVLKDVCGISKFFNVPIPAYVINRYFPKFKGYSRIAPNALLENMLRIARFSFDETEFYAKVNAFSGSFDKLYSFGNGVFLSYDEIYKISIRLYNAYKRFLDNCNFSLWKDIDFQTYCQLHINIWNLYNSTIYRLFALDDSIPWQEKFDNWNDVKRYHFPIFGEFGFESERLLSMVSDFNPNNYVSNCYKNRLYTQYYNENIKHRSVSNEVYLLDDDCEL